MEYFGDYHFYILQQLDTRERYSKGAPDRYGKLPLFTKNGPYCITVHYSFNMHNRVL